MLAGRDIAVLQRFLLPHRWQDAAFIILGGRAAGRDAGARIGRAIILIFAIQLQETVKGNHGTGGAELRAGILGGDIHRRLIHLGRSHLGRNRALPDQIIKPGLRAFQFAAHGIRAACHVRRADRLMRFLRVFGFRCIFARCGGHVIRPECAFHVITNGGNGFARHGHAIRPHIGDVAGFIQSLRRAHGLLRAHAELARCFHLQRGGHEGRRRVPPYAALFHRRHAIEAAFGELLRAHRRCFIRQIELFKLAAFKMREPRGEGRAGRRGEAAFNGPVFARAKRLDLCFAFANQTQRHGLHAARGTRAWQFPPQHRRKRIAHQIIQRAPRQIGFDQRLIQIPRMRHRILYSALGDFIEGDALNMLALQRPTLGQHILHMPGNRFPFTVRVGGQIQSLGALQRSRNAAHLLFAARVLPPEHGEILIWQDRAIFFFQIADMAIGGQYREIPAQIFFNRLRLGRRFHNDNVAHAFPIHPRPDSATRWPGSISTRPSSSRSASAAWSAGGER